MKKFITNGACIQDKNYMVLREDTLKNIMNMIDEGSYLIISRPRQYGKTTLIAELYSRASSEFEIVNMPLSRFSKAAFNTEESFALAFCNSVIDLTEDGLTIPAVTMEQMQKVIDRRSEMNLQNLMTCIRNWCRNALKPVVLILDEVDYAQGSDIFRDFLGKLRIEYLMRNTVNIPALQSVILSGVSDVEHLKSGIRAEGESIGTGSPWNIANNIEFPLELSTEGIEQMLTEYEFDHHTGMNISAIAHAITKWTNGYPYLVSRICQIIDAELVPGACPALSASWTSSGVDKAAVRIIKEENTLFSSLMEKVRDYPALAQDLSDFLYRGKYINYRPDNDAQKSMMLYGFVRCIDTHIEIANEIFKARLSQWFDDVYFQTHLPLSNALDMEIPRGQFIAPDGTLDVYHMISGFVEAFGKVRNDTRLSEDEAEAKFIEEDGRRMFLLYMVPIINGYGTYTIEEQTLDKRRMDIVIHFRGRRYIIELKIWHGLKHNVRGETQLLGYMAYYEQTVGYMLSFSFNQSKQTGITMHQSDDKIIYEAIV